jgi:pyrroline-5-carboxylate reductase
VEQFGFIGCGNMGSAVATAIAKSIGGAHLLLANRTPAKAEALAAQLGGRVATNEAVAQQARWIVLAVKPQMMEGVLQGIAPILAQRAEGQAPFTLVTMAAGISIQRLRHMAGGNYPVVRIMPNTPTAIGWGTIPYCADGVTEEELSAFLQAMERAGQLDALPEELMDAASCVAGCGPAWVYQMIEALADGGVACGLPRDKALRYAAQMTAGSAQLVLQSGQHPGALKDAVCSPGGSTIQGVRTLEERGFRGAVMDAVIAAYEKTKSL